MFELELARATEDIDFLVDPDKDNVARIRIALACLPDGASKDVADGDVADYVVIRINDEITVDLMASACGVGYGEAAGMMEWREIRGVRVPVANAQLLWKTKQTGREKDALDRSFLRKWFADHGMEPPATGGGAGTGAVSS